MRPIKFRAWITDDAGSYMQQWFPSFFSDMSPVTGYGSDIPEDDDVILMQFTGLHDENGGEIYEGDIISESMWDIPAVYCGEDLFTIEYLHSGYAKVPIDKTNKGRWYLCEYFDPHGVLNNLQNIAVIGNIYENPELLP